MKKLNLITVVWLLMANILCSQTPSLSPDLWDKCSELSDEFNSGPLNTNLWNDNDPSNGRLRSHYIYVAPENILFGNSSVGNLNVIKLRMKKERVERSSWNNGGITQTRYLTEGVICSKTKFRYGYYEIYARLSKDQHDATAPDMFLWGVDDNTKNYSEIDVFEYQDDEPGIFPMAAHFGYACNGNSGNYIQYVKQTHTQITENLTDGFHKIGLNWQPDRLEYYIDDKLVFSLNNIPYNTGPCKVGDNVPISDLVSMPLLLANGIYNKPGIDEPSISGYDFEIDYFRYYKKKPFLDILSYDLSTHNYKYIASTQILGDMFYWTFNDPSKVENVKVSYAPGYSIIDFNIKPNYINDNTLKLSVEAIQNLKSDNTVKSVQSSDNIYIKGFNTKFLITKIAYENSQLNLYATALSDNVNSEWDIAKEVNGTWTWLDNYRQWGKTAILKNLDANETYLIKHGEYGAGIWTESRKTVFVKYNSDFYIDDISDDGTAGKLKLKVRVAAPCPNSEWRLYKINSDGSTTFITENWGNEYVFTNLDQGNYRINHGAYISNKTWTSTTKDVVVEHNADFRLIGNKDYAYTGKYQWYEENNQLRINCWADVDHPISQWFISYMDIDGNKVSTPVVGPLYGNQLSVLTDKIVPGNRYTVTHGNYGGYPYTARDRVIDLMPDKFWYDNIYTIGDNISGSIKSNEIKEYQFFVPTTSNIRLTACNSNYDTKLWLYDYNNNLVAYNDDYCGLQSAIVKQLTRGYYKIKIGGYGTSYGNFSISINDINTYVVTGNLTINGSNIGRPDFWDVDGLDGADMPYLLILPEPGIITISTCSNTNFDSKLQLFKSNGTPVKGFYNDDYCGLQSSVSGDLPEGSYYAVVDGFNGAQGNFQLTINFAKSNKSAVESDSVANSKAHDFGEDAVNTTNDITVFPNPARNYVTIKLPDDNLYTIELVDISGKVLSTIKSEGAKVNFDCSDITNGIYILRVLSPDKIYQKKITIER